MGVNKLVSPLPYYNNYPQSAMEPTQMKSNSLMVGIILLYSMQSQYVIYQHNLKK